VVRISNHEDNSELEQVRWPIHRKETEEYVFLHKFYASLVTLGFACRASTHISAIITQCIQRNAGKIQGDSKLLSGFP
jgi:hypothetical protein